MFPAALAIVLDAFPVRERGRAMAIFFAVAGGLTSIGPIAGGYLTEWTWRAIFWVNIPVAIIALFLTCESEARQQQAPGAARLPRHGAGLRRHGPGVLGLQQSASGAGATPRPGSASPSGSHPDRRLRPLRAAGRANPLLQMRIFENRAFAVDNIVLFLLMIPFVPLFFFASSTRRSRSAKAPRKPGSTC